MIFIPDYSKMLLDICELVETDFCFDMESRLIDKDVEFTIEESKEMANRLAKVYSIAHGIHCEACGGKYVTKKL